MPRKIEAPYYVILTDNGFVGEYIEWFTQFGHLCKRFHVEALPIYPDRYEDKWKKVKGKWVCEKNKHVAAWVNERRVLKRKTRKSAEYHLKRSAQNYGAHGKNRFPNPKIIYIEDSTVVMWLRKLYETSKINYNEWNW